MSRISTDTATDSFAAEAESFDAQIVERLENGHVPDLRRSGRCEWFRNNVWRDAAYVDMIYGGYVRQILAAIDTHSSLGRARILEVGCGPGHVALELSRNGHDVVGIDLSAECIDVARGSAGSDPWADRRGGLAYCCGSLDAFEDSEPFDVAIFVGSLHHFADVPGALRKVDTLLAPGGLVYVNEPNRDSYTQGDALVMHLIRVLLSSGNHYHEPQVMPAGEAEFGNALDNVRREMACVTKEGAKTQSPHDNDATFGEMLEALRHRFDVLEEDDEFAFADRVIGGLRFEDVEDEHRTAQWLYEMDRRLREAGVISPQRSHLLARKRRDTVDEG